ncbi:MAG TPA: Uma2 family endonuclease [Longimicrobium sp.]|jgi:Uma2 family endonuclease|uniref:Uma2 family endonuclease n=1 Tax=Longimicrobium sp. TaxID=2029185 RepID=UPI002EDA497B
MKIAPLGREATIDDLYKVEGKAELVDGRIVLMSPTGGAHGKAAKNILFSLTAYERSVGGGMAFGDAVGFIYSPRRSFSPDAAWYVGPEPTEKMLDGAPLLAVEVRSPEDYGPAAERRMAAKRAAYFDCGTQVVWDVDGLRAEVIRVYRATDPESADVYKRGEVADAEPAVPGWRFPVDELFL